MEEGPAGEYSKEKFLRERVRLCPHCGKPIKVIISTEIMEFGDASDVAGNLTWKAGLDPEQIRIVEEAKASGLFEIFETTVRERISTQTPKNIEKFFVTFMQTAVLKTVPHRILIHFIKMFDKAKIEFWCAQGICIVVADGYIRAIMPQDVIVGKNIAVLGRQKKRVSLPADLESFYQRVANEAHYLDNGQRTKFSILQRDSRPARESIFKE